ncbi:MAG: hypothetical protein A2W85_03860 [Bacteroidetes bacterium GWF2_41_31]|nr:MAG: hypothetical protein A2W85_03860 [Bacteroidetes bacterium GWF2_41_31]
MVFHGSIYESILKLAVPGIVTNITVPLLGWLIWDGIFVGVTASKQMRNAMIVSSLVIFLPAYHLTDNSWGNNALWFALNLFMVARGLLMWWMCQKVRVT